MVPICRWGTNVISIWDPLRPRLICGTHVGLWSESRRKTTKWTYIPRNIFMSDRKKLHKRQKCQTELRKTFSAIFVSFLSCCCFHSNVHECEMTFSKKTSVPAGKKKMKNTRRINKEILYRIAFLLLRARLNEVNYIRPSGKISFRRLLHCHVCLLDPLETVHCSFVHWHLCAHGSLIHAPHFRCVQISDECLCVCGILACVYCFVHDYNF